MPLYEYTCDACGHSFEVIQKFSDPPVETCPKCGGRVHKEMSSPAFQFKGTGWYVTDYARKDKGGAKAEKADKTDKADTGKSETKDAAASESKPAAGKDTPKAS
jgi:putative FmdB family regulatory protein